MAQLRRLWVCPECGVVKAYADMPPAVAERLWEFVPKCHLHTEHWPDGEYTRDVEMLRTSTLIEVETEVEDPQPENPSSAGGK